MVTDMNTPRGYTMTTRARSVEETRSRILRACVDLAGERLLTEVGLDAIAGRAEVSVQTVLRHFGSRAGLFEAAIGYARTEVAAEREAPVGDVEAALTSLVDHYERRGRAVLLLLGQESTDELIARITEHGRRYHREWVATVFAPFGAGTDEELTDLLVVATDLYTWKLLRLDRGLSRARTLDRMSTLVAAVLAAAPSPEG
jgi:AcrR family transcriptional regulator